MSVAILLDKFIAASSAAIQEENDARLQEKKDQQVVTEPAIGHR